MIKFIIILLSSILAYSSLYASSIQNTLDVGKNLKVVNKYITGGSLVNGTFEGSTAGWSLAHTNLSGVYPSSVATAGMSFSSSSGGSSATGQTLSYSSSSPLSGNYSGILTYSGSSSTIGDMLISDSFAIDSSSKASVLTISFSHSTVSGTINLSGTASNTYAVWVYDVDNASWIMPSGVYGMIQNNNALVKNITFQTSSNGSKYQVALININTASSFSLKLDEFSVSTQVSSSGPAMSDTITTGTITIGAVTTAPTKGTTAIDSVSYKRLGDIGHFVYQYKQTTTGAIGSGDYLFSLPNGLKFDSSKVTFYTGSSGTYSTIPNVGLGKVHISYSGTSEGSDAFGVIVPYDNYRFRVMYRYLTSSVGTNSSFMGSGTYGYPLTLYSLSLFIEFDAAISGWSSNTAQSSDTDTRVVAGTIANNGTTLTLPASTSTKITNMSVFSDSHGAYDTANNKLVIPVSGKYQFSACGAFYSNSGSAGLYAHIFYYVNSSGGAEIAITRSTGSGNLQQFCGSSIIVNLKANDVIEFYAAQDNAGYIYIGSSWTNISWMRLSGPAVVQANENVSVRYTSNSGQIISSGTETTVLFPTKMWDTHGAYNPSTGVFTAPVSGEYELNFMFQFDSNAWTASTGAYTFISGATTALLDDFAAVYAFTYYVTQRGKMKMRLKQGETFSLKTRHSRGSATSLRASSDSNWIEITRTGY